MTHKMRPRLQQFVDELPENAVEKASRAAFALLRKGPGRLRDAAQELSRPLKGVGPAMASLVLAAFDGSRCAYMSDAALLAVLGTRDYSEAELVALTAALTAKAQALGAPWTAQRCQRALWTVATLEPGVAPPLAAIAGAKRGREPAAAAVPAAAAAAVAPVDDDGGATKTKLGGRKRPSSS